MKRRRNLPKPIPPRSVVQLVRVPADAPEWAADLHRRFRIGYYRPQDGLDCIWLVNDNGEYEQTTGLATLVDCFKIEKLSHVRDFFGSKQRRLGPIRSHATSKSH